MTMSPGVEQRLELAHHLIDRLAGLDHHHDPARALEHGDQLLEGAGREQPAAALRDRGVGELAARG